MTEWLSVALDSGRSCDEFMSHEWDGTVSIEGALYIPLVGAMGTSMWHYPSIAPSELPGTH